MSASEATPRIALAIQRLAPAGGLEQHCLRLAEVLTGRGAQVTILTTESPLSAPCPGVRLTQIARHGLTNHDRLCRFADDAAKAGARGEFDLTVAFHAIPGFDAIFCADPSRARPSGLRRWLPRYRTFARLERAALQAGSTRLVLLLSTAQQAAFARSHGELRPRVAVLSPTVDRSKFVAAAPSDADKAAARSALGMEPGVAAWLWMGLQPKTKGLDRAITALRRFPQARLIVCGPAANVSGAAAWPNRLASRLGVQERLVWLGFVEEPEVRRAMAAADLLLHPSRADVTGTVILEALACGLPVVTTEVCGYGQHVLAAGAGRVLAEPFRQDDLETALADADAGTLRRWARNAYAYAAQPQLYRGLDEAADLILATARGP
jgi:UDP-glucose:(heptosyl)LPS alpha-1,3-glucosyltransferase